MFFSFFLFLCVVAARWRQSLVSIDNVISLGMMCAANQKWGKSKDERSMEGGAVVETVVQRIFNSLIVLLKFLSTLPFRTDVCKVNDEL